MKDWPTHDYEGGNPMLHADTTLKGYDPIEVKQRTCQVCGMLLDDVGEFHPYVFCILKKAGRDPWQDFRATALMLGLADPGEKPPLVREIHRV